MILFTREFSVSNSAGWYSLTFVKMQEENWGDIEKVFQKKIIQNCFYMNNGLFQYQIKNSWYNSEITIKYKKRLNH